MVIVSINPDDKNISRSFKKPLLTERFFELYLSICSVLIKGNITCRGPDDQCGECSKGLDHKCRVLNLL